MCIKYSIAWKWELRQRERKMLAFLSSPQGNSLFLKGREPLIAILAKGRICVFQEGEPYILCHRNTSMDIENKLLNVHHVQVCWLAASSKKTFADKSFNEQLKKCCKVAYYWGNIFPSFFLVKEDSFAGMFEQSPFRLNYSKNAILK